MEYIVVKVKLRSDLLYVFNSVCLIYNLLCIDFKYKK